MTRFNAGIDIEEIGRFKKLDLKKNRHFFELIYTPREIEYCLSKPNPYNHLAARFAGKEAIIKVIKGWGRNANPSEIEILNDKNGMPVVNIKSKKIRNIKIIVSLSHCSDKALAFAWGALNGSR